MAAHTALLLPFPPQSFSVPISKTSKRQERLHGLLEAISLLPLGQGLLKGLSCLKDGTSHQKWNQGARPHLGEESGKLK